MARKTKHNPERTSFKGKSYKKGGQNILDLQLEKEREDAWDELREKEQVRGDDGD